MAPMVGPSRSEVAAMLRSLLWKRKLPITLANNAPCAVVDRVGGVLRLRELRVDHVAAEAEHQRRIASGDCFWMPEHLFAFMKPARTVIEDRDRDAFVEKLLAIDPWAYGPDC